MFEVHDSLVQSFRAVIHSVTQMKQKLVNAKSLHGNGTELDDICESGKEVTVLFIAVVQ